MSKIVLFLCSALVLFANTFHEKESVGIFSLPNQFDEKQTIDNRIETIIVSFEKETGAEVNEYLSHQDKAFLQQHHAVFIANISGMPSIITKMFALPKMRDYKHSILLIYDENDNRFTHQENKSTLYKLKNGVIQSISFITKEDLQTVFK